MVTVTPEAAAGANPAGQGSDGFAKIRARFHRPTHQSAHNTPDVDMKTNEFVNKVDSGSLQNKRGKRLEGTGSEFSTFSGDTIKQYGTFLDNFVRNISKKMAEDTTLLDQPGFERVSQLMQMLSVNGDPSPEGIAKFLTTHQGLSIANQIMDEQMAVQLMALGWDANIRYGEDTQKIHVTTLFNLGKSGIKRDGWRRNAHIAAVNTLGAGNGLGGAAIGGGIGAGIGYAIDHASLADVTSFARAIGTGLSSGTVVGAAIGAGIGGYVGHEFFSPNGDVDLHACADALAAIKSDPNRVAYVKAISGIDANDFIVNGNEVQFDPARPIHETQNIRTRINDIGKTLQTRRSFYEDLGEPYMKRGEMMEQLFTRYNDEGREQMLTRWAQRQQELLNPNGAAYQAMNAEQRRVRFLEVQQEVLGEYIEDYFNKVFDGPKHDTAAVSSMEAKVVKGKSKEDWEARQATKKTRLEADKTYLETEQKKIFGDKTSEDQNFAKFDEAKQKVEAEYSLNFKDDATATTPLTLEQAIQKRFDLLKKSGKGSVRAMRKQALKDLRAVEALYAPVQKKSVIPQSTGGPISVTEEVDHPNVAHAREIYASQLEQITILDNDLTNEVGALRELMARRDAAEAGLAKLRSGSVGYAGFVESSQRAFAELTRAGILTQAELATLSFDDIYKRVNDFHKANPTSTQAWAEADNGNEVHRQKLSQAIVEATAAERSLNTNVGNENSLYQLITYQGLTEAALLGAPDIAAVHAMINGRNAADPTKGWPPALNPTMDPMITGAIAAAGLRANFRKEAFDVVIENVDVASKLADATKTVFKENPAVARIEIAIDAARRQGDILTATTDLTRNYNEFFSANPAQVGGDLTNEEKAILTAGGAPVAVPEGYFNIVDLIFDYSHKGADRGSYFAKIQSMLNPDQLAAVADDVFNFGLVPGAGGPGGLNMTNVMTEIQQMMDDRHFGQRELRRLCTTVINDLIRTGNAISL